MVDGGGGDNRSCKMCKSLGKSSPPTNQHIWDKEEMKSEHMKKGKQLN